MRKLWRSALAATLVAAVSPLAVGAQAPEPPVPTCRGQEATIVGTAAGEVIKGTSGNDVIVALGGNDTVYAGAGNDIVCGNFGADRLYGGVGWDDLNGGFGDDELYGGLGRDRLAGGPGEDALKGHGGNDRLLGGSGPDMLQAGVGNDVAFGGTGNDTANGGPGDDMVRGDAGNDVANGGFGNDEVHGGAGDDIVNGGGGNDVLYPGPGDNTVDPGPGRDSCPIGCEDNDPSVDPNAIDDEVTTQEDTPVNFDVLANDIDPDSDLTVTSLSDTSQGGTVAVAADGSVDYTPVGDASGSDSFTYTVSDGTDDFDTATVIVTIDPVNDAPIGNDDTAPTVEDTSVEIEVLANDVDVDSDLQVVSVDDSGVIPGSQVEITESSRIIYTPAPDQNGVDSFDYTVSDGELTDTATVTVTIAAANDSPFAVDDDATTDEDTAVEIDVLANDGDVDFDEFTIESVSEASSRGGSVALDDQANLVLYTPPADANGTDTFTYTVTDGAEISSATVTVTINPVNDAPIGNDDTAPTVEDTSVEIEVLTNDVDIDGNLAVVSVDDDDIVDGAEVEITESSTIIYTPAPDHNGVDSFDYTVSDGELTDTATVNVTIAAVNDLPMAADDTATTDEDTPVYVEVLANDSDRDNDLTVTSVSDAPSGAIVTIDEDTDLVRYTPAADANGIDTFTYTVTDGVETDSATVTVTVNAVNDAPVANDDYAPTVEDEPVEIDVLANDVDVDSDLQITSVDDSGVIPGSQVEITESGSIIYTPAPDQSGYDSFEYTVSDGFETDTATVELEIAAVNDAPVAGDDTATTDEDTSILIPVLENDFDIEGDNLSIYSVSETSARGGSVSIDYEANMVIYTPPADASGTDTFVYTVTDYYDHIVDEEFFQGDFLVNGDEGLLFETDDHGGVPATVTVTINPVNDAPVAGDDPALTTEDTSVEIDVLVNDLDVDSDIEIVGVDDSGVIPGAEVELTESGIIIYTPAPDQNGVDSFDYTVSDGFETDTATVTVTIAEVNDAPVANDDSETTDEDSTVFLNVLLNDIDIDNDLQELVVSVSEPALGGSVTNFGFGELTYTPPADVSGEDSFDYTVSDGQYTDTATVTITINSVNDAPVANDDSEVTGEDNSIEINVLDNDEDVDGDNLSLESWDESTDNGQVELSGDRLIYTPNSNFNGSESFTYRVTDGDLSASATVTVEVGAINDAPIAVVDFATTDEDSAVEVDVLLNDSDVDNSSDDLSIISTTDAVDGGEVENLGNGVVRYTPPADASGVTYFTYTVSDGEKSDIGTVVMTLTPVDEDPCVGPDSNDDPNDPYNIDLDGDSCTPNNGDCDDTNPAIHPGAEDIPGDGLDQDCDGEFA